MGTIFLIILGIGTVFGIGAFVLSQKADPAERAQEAGTAAAAGAMMTAGCMLRAILAALPVLFGLFLLSLILRGCN